MISRCRGFTLVELMTVMAIVAILAGVAAPALGEFVTTRRVQAAASTLAHALKAAQAEAIRRNRTVEVVFTNSAPTRANVATAAPIVASAAGGYLTRVNGAAAADDYVTGARVDEGGSLRLDNAAVSAVGFTALGRPVDLSGGAPVALAQPVVLRVIDNPSARRMCVTVATGGSVRICDPTRSPPSAAACEPTLPPGGC